ncbi:unnamed protein product [Ceutorhynchus assimilis]|uniref:Golgi integral membrane protein 4 n=1 Tax=Ceutorhynchus assimilis TaxID=467358 RepID=A0A9N9QHY5_9CUCU|nr:unnamed protein product [Ceutorhynchus assimilis]
MTSSRVIRGTKAKMFLYVCAILAITGLIACYNSTLTQLDEVKKSKDICQQEQDNLSTQLQVISDYKQKLEKSLKNEKAEHQQSKNALEIKINEEKNRNKQIANDALIKYNSLQQHYKLLQTEHDDFKEENGKTQKKHSEEVNSLQLKLKEVEEELKKVKASKESLKTQFTELELENIQLKLLQKSNTTGKFYGEEYRILEDKYRALMNKCGDPSEETPLVQAAPSEKAVLHVPAFKRAENPSSSTKALPKMSPSKSNSNGVKPVNLSSPTPETVKKEVNLKAPQGVVEPPENREDQNEQPQVQMDQKGVDDNAAHEVFDGPNADGLNFADEKINGAVEQKNDGKKRYDQDYKDLQHEEEGDDDADDYGDRHVRGAGEVAIRN